MAERASNYTDESPYFLVEEESDIGGLILTRKEGKSISFPEVGMTFEYKGRLVDKRRYFGLVIRSTEGDFEVALKYDKVYRVGDLGIKFKSTFYWFHPSTGRYVPMASFVFQANPEISILRSELLGR